MLILIHSLLQSSVVGNKKKKIKISSNKVDFNQKVSDYTLFFSQIIKFKVKKIKQITIKRLSGTFTYSIGNSNLKIN